VAAGQRHGDRLPAVRSAQQGLTPSELQAMLQDTSQAFRLIGVGGVFVTLLATNTAFLLIPILRIKVLRHEPLAEIGFRADNLRRLVLLGIGLGVLSLLINVALGLLFQSFGIQPDQAASYPLDQGDYGGQALFLIGAAMIAPIGEEVLFRGYVFNAIRQTFGQRRWGVPMAFVLSALLFSIVHSLAVSQGLIGLLVPIFVVGLILAWSMHTTGSLVPGIIAHAINNGVAIMALIACVNNPGMTGCR
jgi:membrane protease YdiL (CAAX protease family)